MSFISNEKIYNYSNIAIISSIVGFDIMYHHFYGFNYFLTEIVSLAFQLAIFIISYDYLIFKNTLVFNKGKVGLIITDPSEEIDDEVALHHLFKQIEIGVQKFDKIFIVFANGAYNSHTTSEERMQHFKKMFPTFDTINPTINSTKFLLITSDKLKEYEGNHFDVFLQIAPLCGLGSEFFKNNSFDIRIVMGDLDNPKNSINLKKSWKDNIELDDEFNQQEEALKLCKVRFITTNLARKVPLTFDNIKRLPQEMKNMILDKSFKLFIGRVPFNSPYCENVTVNANYTTIMNYLGLDAETKVKNHSNDSLEVLCEDFVRKMSVCNNKERMIGVLNSISSCVEIITGCNYTDSNFQFQSINDTFKAKDNFINYISKNKCDMTPAYDLTAMLLFLRPDITCSNHTDNGMKFDESYLPLFKSKLSDY